VLIGPFGRHPATGVRIRRPSRNKMAHRRPRSSRALRRRRAPGSSVDRLIGELLTEQAQDATVNLVQTELVDSEERQTLNGDVSSITSCPWHRGEVTNSSQEAIGDARRTATAPAMMHAASPFSVTSSRPADRLTMT